VGYLRQQLSNSAALLKEWSKGKAAAASVQCRIYQEHSRCCCFHSAEKQKMPKERRGVASKAQRKEERGAEWWDEV